jgi:hypothetical protein
MEVTTSDAFTPRLHDDRSGSGSRGSSSVAFAQSSVHAPLQTLTHHDMHHGYGYGVASSSSSAAAAAAASVPFALQQQSQQSTSTILQQQSQTTSHNPSPLPPPTPTTMQQMQQQFQQFERPPSVSMPGTMTVDPRPRRMSMDEDVFYRELMTSRPANPPSYESAMKAAMLAQRRAEQQLQRNRFSVSSSIPSPEQDVLPPYKCGVNVEGVFMRKMEIEETIKRAEYRTWQQVYVELRGTALNIYQVKKERGWWSSAKHHSGPDISPDSPPWIKKGQLEKSYSLLHADAGIAADYRK